MTTPDLSSLSARMRFAADVLEEAMEHDFCKTPVWHPDSLRRVADRLDGTTERPVISERIN